MTRVCLIVGLLLLTAPPAWAGAPDDLRDLSLEDLFAIRVRVATKTELESAHTPAVVTVIGADEIQARGYTSLADILRAVPGFYDVYDGVTHNVGVRGINGGQNASGNVIKLMIDGHAVDYRPTTGNFFGEELIPIQAIDRVEILRGPASALYGANAFLGVVNVITRAGGTVHGVRLIGVGALERDHLGGGGGLIAGASSGPLDVLVGASYLYLDRSGLTLPSSSPHLIDQIRGPSTNDLAQPVSFFGKVALDGQLWGRVTLMASVQSLDSRGEFQPYGPLSHRTRIALVNQNYRLSYEVTPVDRLTLVASLHYFNGAPTSKTRIDVGRDDYQMLPAVGAYGGGFTAEARVKAHRMVLLAAGLDFVHERHTLETFDQQLLMPVYAPDGTTVLRSTGTIIPGPQHGATAVFRNVGTYVQGIVTPRPEWTVVAGARVDYHTIYGANLSTRAGAVYSSGAFQAKLLYGSSFKAPSAEQLYAQPIGFEGIQGNASLQPQTAHTLEAAGGYQLPNDRGSIVANFFATDVVARVELIESGAFVRALNFQDEWVLGGELDSRFVPVRPLRLRFSAGVAHSVARTPGAPLVGRPPVANPLFPEVQLHLMADWILQRWGLRFGAEISYIGQRSSSLSNALILGRGYDLPGYVYTALTASTAGLHLIPKRDTNIALRLSNVINYHWAEPGFVGIDVPAQGLVLFLTLVQAL